MQVLLHNSHHQSGRPDGWSGAPGEAAWVMELNDRIEARAKAVGITVMRADGDLQDHPEFHADYALFDAPHYEANLHYTIGSYLRPTMRCGLVPQRLMSQNRLGRPLGFSTDPAGHVGGWLWGRAAQSLTAPLDDKIGGIFQQQYVRLQQAFNYDLPFRNNWNNVNITDYYGFRLTSDKTSGWLTEHGVGAPTAPDHDWLYAHLDDIANVHVASYALFNGGTVDLTDYHIFGQSATTLDALVQFARKQNPSFPIEWAQEYYGQASLASMRVEFPFAQFLKESNYGKFTGDVPASYNNPVGIGATGGAGVGAQFPTKRDGVTAHLQHLLWYLWPAKHSDTPFCVPLIDPRHTGIGMFSEHKMLGNDVRLLDGKWATPGPTYGEDIAHMAQAIRELGGTDVPDLATIQKMIDTSIASYGVALENNELQPNVFTPIADHETRLKKLETGTPAHEHKTLVGSIK